MRDPMTSDLLQTEVAEAVALAFSVDVTDEILLGCIIDGIYKAGWELRYALDDSQER